jgi:hypothetical protein
MGTPLRSVRGHPWTPSVEVHSSTRVPRTPLQRARHAVACAGQMGSISLGRQVLSKKDWSGL